MKATEIIGKDVVTLDGGKVGKIQDLIIDNNWIVRGLILRLTREAAKAASMGFTFRPTGVVEVSLVKGVSDYVTLVIDFNSLGDAIKKA